MNRPERRSILCIGIPGSGKTALTLRIGDEMILHPGFDSVFVCDRLEQHSTPLDRYVGDLEAQLEALEEDEARVREAVKRHGRAGLAARRLDGPLIRDLGEYADFCGMLAASRRSSNTREVPRRVIWRCGPQPAAYGPAMAEACDQGHVALVCCESRGWWPNYRHEWPLEALPGRPDVTLEHLLSMGRAHIRNRAGEYCPVHLVLDAQDFAMVHWMVRRMTLTVLCSRLEGGEAYSIIQREFGDGTGALVKKVRALGPHEWLAVRGEMPELAPFRGGGR